MNFQKFIFDNEFWAFLYRQGCLKILLCKTQSRNLKFRKFCNFYCIFYLKFEYETFGSKHIIWFRIRTFSTDVFWNESFVVAHYVAVEVADSEICSQPFFEVDWALINIYDSLLMSHKLWRTWKQARAILPLITVNLDRWTWDTQQHTRQLEVLQSHNTTLFRYYNQGWYETPPPPSSTLLRHQSVKK